MSTTNKSLEIAWISIRNEILEDAAKAADGNAPDNEPGEYWRGRRDAAALIRKMKEART